MTANSTSANYGYCTMCGQYHAPSTVCPPYRFESPMYPPSQTFYVGPTREAEILATLERIEALLRELLSQRGGAV